jgi:hypothetical protein
LASDGAEVVRVLTRAPGAPCVDVIGVSGGEEVRLWRVVLEKEWKEGDCCLSLGARKMGVAAIDSINSTRARPQRSSRTASRDTSRVTQATTGQCWNGDGFGVSDIDGVEMARVPYGAQMISFGCCGCQGRGTLG